MYNEKPPKGQLYHRQIYSLSLSLFLLIFTARRAGIGFAFPAGLRRPGNAVVRAASTRYCVRWFIRRGSGVHTNGEHLSRRVLWSFLRSRIARTSYICIYACCGPAAGAFMFIIRRGRKSWGRRLYSMRKLLVALCALRLSHTRRPRWESNSRYFQLS